MQFSNILTALALAMTASALPAAENAGQLAARTEPHRGKDDGHHHGGETNIINSGNRCPANKQISCCNGSSGLLLSGLLNCVNIIGGRQCDGETRCCDQSTSGGVVNIQTCGGLLEL